MRVTGWFIVLAIGLMHSKEDIQRGEIRRQSAGIAAMLSIGYAGIRYLENDLTFTEVIRGWYPAAVLLMIAFLSKGQMGYGDVFELWIWGNILGAKPVLEILMIALALCAIVGVGSVLQHHREWKSRMAFIPFFTLGGLLWGILQIIGNNYR